MRKYWELLQHFDKYWKEKMRKGEVSGISGCEWCMLESFAIWLDRNTDKVKEK